MIEAKPQRVHFRHNGEDLMVLGDPKTLPRVGENVLIELASYVVINVIHCFTEAVTDEFTVIVHLDPVDINIALAE